MAGQEEHYSKDPLIFVERNNLVESIHYGHAILFDGKELKSLAGDPEFRTFSRSSIKIIQAKVAKDILQDKLSGKELAIACASHTAEEEQLAAVTSLKEQFDLDESLLACGTKSVSRGSLTSKLHHNCSGKQMALLAACKEAGYPLSGFEKIDHPIQTKILDELKRLKGSSEEIKWGIDGCGIPNFHFSLSELIGVFHKIIADPEYKVLIEAINEFPDLIHGQKLIDTVILKSYPKKFFSKTGAEGVQVIAKLDSKEVLLLKIQDGSNRAKAAATKLFLERLGWASELDIDINIYNSTKLIVGKFKINS